MSDASVQVMIREKATQVVRNVQEKWVDGHLYLWSDGNYECDCNRHVMFADADPAVQCNADRATARYEVRIVDHTGHILYDEWEANDDTR